MGDFVKVARTSEIPPGARKSVWVEGIRVLVLNIGGTYYAVDDSCPHRECSMEHAKLKGTTIICPCHLAQFDLETGEVLAEPVEFPPTGPLPVHQAKTEGLDILIALTTDFDSI